LPYSLTKALGTGVSQLDVEQIAAPSMTGAIALDDYYSAKRKMTGRLPNRREIELAELAKLGLAGNVFILEPVPGEDDWRYRLIGTEIITHFEVDRTNMGFREYVVAERADVLIKASDDIAESREPGYFRLKPRDAAEDGLLIETMSLPILGNDGQTVMLFGGTFFK
jgi:hypothetical protein